MIIKNLKKLKMNVNNAIDTIKVNINKYKGLKEQLKKSYPTYLNFFKKIYKNIDLFDQSFEEVFPSANAQYNQYCYGS